MLIPDIFFKFPLARPKKGIIHIGAHKCEEESLYTSLGLSSQKILWIEANPELVKSQSHRPNLYQAVISDKDDELVQFMITNNGESSSIYNFKTHEQEHPHVVEIGRVSLYTTTLDTFYDTHHLAYDQFDVMNIDIQGAELVAFKGATRILPFLRAIYAEVNEKELYDGCGMIDQVDSYLSQFGFRRVITSMTKHGWGDALYFNTTYS
jgi:FkbM family methyltransferase